MLNTFIVQIAMKLFELLGPMLVKALIDAFIDYLPKLVALIPITVAASLTGLGKLIPNLTMPDVPAIVTGAQDVLREHDPDVPLLSDLVEKVTGFDLTQFLSGLGR